MDRYETRRLALKALVDGIGRGGRAEVAKRIEKEASYVSRLLYPPGKEGRKRIGDELLEAITKAYPNWLDQPTDAAAAPPARSRAKSRQSVDHVGFDAFTLPRPDPLPPVAERLELASWEVQRKLGYLPEPGRIQLFTHLGLSMRPIMEEGDVAFIDTQVTQFAGDDCYLIRMGDDLQIKLLQRRGPDLWVVSQNPDFPAWRCTEESDIIISGKVVMRASLRAI